MVTPDSFHVFAKNSLKEDTFEEEKSLIVTGFFLENSPLQDVFWPRPGLQPNHRTVRKSAILPQPSNQKRLI